MCGRTPKNSKRSSEGLVIDAQRSSGGGSDQPYRPVTIVWESAVSQDGIRFARLKRGSTIWSRNGTYLEADDAPVGQTELAERK